MSYLHTPWPYLATAAMIALIAIYAWKQPHRPGMRFFFWVLGLWLITTLTAALATIFQATELGYVLWVLQFIGLQLAVSVELMFTLEYTGNERWLHQRSLFLIFLPALIIGLMLILLPMDRLVSVETHFGAEVIVANDPIKWLLFAANSVIWIITVGVLGASLLHAPTFMAPIGLLILGQTLPRFAFLVIDPGLRHFVPGQISLLFSGFIALAYILALYNFRLLRVVPVAWSKAINFMPYSMIILDAEDFLVAFNPSAQSLPGLPGNLALRQAAARSLGMWWERLSPLIGPEQDSQDIEIKTRTGEQYFRVYSWPLLHVSGWRMGQAFIFDDITQERRRQELQTQALWADATLQEREHLAHEIHDGLSQNLAFLNMQAQAALVQIQNGQDPAAQASLNRLIEAAGQIQESTRDLIGNLLTNSLPKGSLRDSLLEILTHFEQQSGLVVHLDMETDKAVDCLFDQTKLPPPTAVQLACMTQEALTNVRKHAREASQVNVHLKTNNGHLILTIKDDGAGFNPATQRNGDNHFGLQVMRQRAARIGGEIAIDSAPGKGTRVEICVPLANGRSRDRK
jgi:signal transduction histidine kinase